MKDIFKKLVISFGKTKEADMAKGFNLERLLKSDNQTNSIIALDDYVHSLCIYGDDISHLTEVQRNFHHIQNLEREVNNGGFWQYFYNSSAQGAAEIVSALNAIGAAKTAVLVQSAIDLFPEGFVPVDDQARRDLIDQMPQHCMQRWSELDQQFFIYEDDLTSLCLEYIRRNKESF